MISVKQLLVNPSKYKIKCPNEMEAEYITIHNTANDASAYNEVQYMINNSSEVSYHFAVDDKEVVQGIPVDRNAWHCGDGAKGTGNRKSIGVEICYSKSGGVRYYQAEALAIKFVAQLLHERGWGIDRVRKHQDWSDKYCPHRILAEGRWQAVLEAIKKELDKLKNEKEEAISMTERDINVVSEWAKKDWEEAVANGYFDGTRPGAPITREEAAVVINRLRHNILKDRM